MWSIFQTITRSWSQHFVEQFSALLIMVAAYSALLFMALSLTNIQKLFDSWGQVHKAHLHWNSQVDETRKKDILNQIEVSEIVDSHGKVSSQASAQKFEKRFSKVSSQTMDMEKVVKYFPEYHVLNLNHEKAYRSGPQGLETFVAQLKTKYPEIKTINYGKSWIRPYIDLLRGLKVIAWFLIGIFLVASILVSSNVIKTALFFKRDEIEILEFIGATDFHIYLPQMLNSLFLGFFSFSIALLLNFGFYCSMGKIFSGLFSAQTLSKVQFLPFSLVLGLFFISLLAVLSSSSLTIFKLLPRRQRLC